MLRRILPVSMISCLCCLLGTVACYQFSPVDRTEEPRYREMLGRVYRLKADFLVHGYRRDRGLGPTAYSYVMRPHPGRISMWKHYTVFWGILPEGSLIKIVEVQAQPPYYGIGYLAEVLDPKDERFEGIKIKLNVSRQEAAYVGSDDGSGVRQLDEKWFERIQ